MSLQPLHPRRLTALVASIGLALIALLPPSAPAQTGTAPPPAGVVQLTGMHTWSAPGGTRVVLEFSGEVTPVSPDSGSGSQLVVAVPTRGISAAAGVPSSLAVADGAVERVESILDATGCRF